MAVRMMDNGPGGPGTVLALKPVSRGVDTFLKWFGEKVGIGRGGAFDVAAGLLMAAAFIICTCILHLMSSMGVLLEGRYKNVYSLGGDQMLECFTHTI
jgi:hypothetical protein